MSESASPHRITFSAPKDLSRNLSALSAATGAPISELVRRAVTAYLVKRRNEWSDVDSELTANGGDQIPKHRMPCATAFAGAASRVAPR